MAKDNAKRETGRKDRGSSSFTEIKQPSKAPRQDELATGGSTAYKGHQVDKRSTEQGISNRPVEEEHAFPESPGASDAGADDSIDTPTKQQGGNRGGV